MIWESSLTENFRTMDLLGQYKKGNTPVEF